MGGQTDLENELRPLFEAGVAYNLMVLDNHIDFDKVNELEELLNKLEYPSKGKVIEIVNDAFEPASSLISIKKELAKQKNEFSGEIFNCIESIKSNCPPWPWFLLQSVVRNHFHSSLFLSLYFYIRKKIDTSKQQNIDVCIPPELNEVLSELSYLNELLTNNIVSIINGGYDAQTSLYQCRVLFNESNATRSKALRVALASARSENPLSLVQHQALKGKRFTDWEKVLVTLVCMQSGMSNSEFLKKHLDSIPKNYWHSYNEPSVLNHHREHLDKCQNSLQSFYFTQSVELDRTSRTSSSSSSSTASVTVQTVLTNWSKTYAIIISHSDFIVDLNEFALQVLNHLKNKDTLFSFLNTISNTISNISSGHKYRELDSLININLDVFLKKESQTLLSLHDANFPSPYWGYFLLDTIITSPIKLLKEYVIIKNECNKCINALTHEQIKNFEKEVNSKLALVMISILRPIFQSVLSPLIMLQTSSPFTIYNKNELDLEVKLDLALQVEEGRFNDKIYLKNASFSFIELEELLMGLAYYYQKSFNKTNTSMSKFINLLDACYKEPINDKKFKKGRKLADDLLNKFNKGEYSLKT